MKTEKPEADGGALLEFLSIPLAQLIHELLQSDVDYTSFGLQDAGEENDEVVVLVARGGKTADVKSILTTWSETES